MSTVLLILIAKYQISEGLNLPKLCSDVRAHVVSEETAQHILDADSKDTYEISINELCEINQ